MSNPEPDITKIFEETTEITMALARAARRALMSTS